VPRRAIATLAALALVPVGAVTAVALGPPEQPQTLSMRPADGAQLPRGVDTPGHDVSRFGTRTAVPEAPRTAKTSRAPKAPEQQPGAVATAAGDVKVPRSRIVERLYLTADLNVWSGPGEQHTLLDMLATGTRVPVTGEVVDGQWAEISYEGLSRWVNAAYLSQDDPAAEVEAPESDTEDDTDVPGRGSGLSTAPCANGSEVESGLTADAIAVHRAVCALFPEVTSYGGLREDSGEHGEGRALDIMITGSVGDEIAEFVRANSGALGASEVIWEQQIWTVERSSEGWRPMDDRGSDTANHYDHVHVTVFGG
jgi:hypothetical protein